MAPPFQLGMAVLQSEISTGVMPQLVKFFLDLVGMFDVLEYEILAVGTGSVDLNTAGVKEYSTEERLVDRNVGDFGEVGGDHFG